MAEYLAPGVYVEERDAGAAPIEGVSMSTAGFLGPTERGPVEPRLITSFAEYRRLYGSYLDGSYHPTAVDGFFTNGGSRCVVGRVTAAETSADGALSEDAPGESGDDVMTVTAVGPGSWGERVAVFVTEASMQDSDEDLFKLIVRYWADEDDHDDAVEGDADVQDDAVPPADVEEVYDDLSPHRDASNFVRKQVNGTSALIEISVDEPGVRPQDQADDEGRPTDPLWLSGSFPDDESPEVDDYEGDDQADPEDRTGFAGFEQIPEIGIVCIPDEHDDSALTDELIAHCETMDDRFAILQAEQSGFQISDLRPPDDTDMAAFYYPWLKARNPDSGMVEEIPPGGHVAGIYARSDSQHGVHKAPANEIIRGIQDIQRPVTHGQQEVLNPRGVNCIRSFRGRGIRVWGARTASSDPQWKYVNVRRLFLFLRESIEQNTQWVVFEPNNEELWARVRQTIKNFLTDVWEDGALMGTSPDEAFFVTCDRTTMTQSDIENGRLICEIGVAPTRPAEFVIFRISQWTAES